MENFPPLCGSNKTAADLARNNRKNRKNAGTKKGSEFAALAAIASVRNAAFQPENTAGIAFLRAMPTIENNSNRINIGSTAARPAVN